MYANVKHSSPVCSVDAEANPVPTVHLPTGLTTRCHVTSLSMDLNPVGRTKQHIRDSGSVTIIYTIILLKSVGVTKL